MNKAIIAPIQAKCTPPLEQSTGCCGGAHSMHGQGATEPQVHTPAEAKAAKPSGCCGGARHADLQGTAEPQMLTPTDAKPAKAGSCCGGSS
jgi:hypothetical protein